ncbi:hypothetical protein mRhiFer1_008330 [Rhinolophus ferrumequinum]|uniref:Uncharacterized protein n=1 Tax=Rhinolophus ferrumequinum TaxID=59479 RepID=A0A7J7VRM7_RHIFE|nr:hypothetical protein mRhiFer1_008330 [Rhinolophus ferrumequinum]
MAWPPASLSSKHLCPSRQQLLSLTVLRAERGSCQPPLPLGAAHQVGVLAMHSHGQQGGWALGQLRVGPLSSPHISPGCGKALLLASASWESPYVFPLPAGAQARQVAEGLGPSFTSGLTLVACDCQ